MDDDINDESLMQMANEFDDFVLNLTQKYEIGLFAICGVALARMYIFSKQFGATDDFIRLLTTIISSDLSSRKVMQSNHFAAPLGEAAVNDAKILANELLAKIAADSKKGN